jgi:hypothetical protein
MHSWRIKCRAEGNTDRRDSASAYSALRGLRTWRCRYALCTGTRSSPSSRSKRSGFWRIFRGGDDGSPAPGSVAPRSPSRAWHGGVIAELFRTLESALNLRKYLLIELDKPAKASQDFVTGSPLKPESRQPSTKRGGVYARESSGSPCGS